MEMKNVNWKELFIDILVDIVAGMIIAVGIYNFALNADFPVAGFSGIAIILYHIFGLPVGAGTIILNVPVAIFCYKFLGKEFFLKYELFVRLFRPMELLVFIPVSYIIINKNLCRFKMTYLYIVLYTILIAGRFIFFPLEDYYYFIWTK